MGHRIFAEYVRAVAAELGWTPGEVSDYNCRISGPDAQRLSIYNGDMSHLKAMKGRVTISLHSPIDEYIPNDLRPRRFTLAVDRGPSVAVREVRKLLPAYEQAMAVGNQARAVRDAARANRLSVTNVVAQTFGGRVTSNDPDYPEVHFDSGDVKIRGSDATFTVKVPARRAAHVADVLALALAASTQGA
ncbi:hypothetical protein ACWZHB_01305 [Nocardia sp. FBN12]|uniref:hypothetical protein n=1 Tax=Nocardia sp. FBN12 TaxID=3419766 RepID=UPI003CFFBAD1